MIELLVVISLLGILAGSFGWSIYRGVERKRFQTTMESLRFHLMSCHRLALNMQADWKVSLDSSKCSAQCIEDPTTPAIPPLQLGEIEIVWGEEKVDNVVFHFTASGDVLPQGTLKIRGKGGVVQWILPEIFSLSAGEDEVKL
jgi:type II secretory pathway pseudopilin PulG